MINLPFFKEPYLHLAIDFQNRYLRGLPPDIRYPLEYKYYRFSQIVSDLLYPRFWVGNGHEFRSYAASVTDHADKRRVARHYGMDANIIEPTDCVFIKGNTGAFMDKDPSSHVRA